MRIVERTRIDRPAAGVWPYIIRPEYFQRWNTKIVSMEARGEFRLGQSFVTHYQMSGKQMQCLSVATEVEEGRLLVLRHSHCVGRGVNPDLEVRERITLDERNGGTLVTKEVLIRNHDVPWLLIPLIWFVTRFGRPSEPDRLKSMCEET
jgi:uncharacterized protein YndB with AHSA1/START domain